MKKVRIILLITGIILLTGCNITINGECNDKDEPKTDINVVEPTKNLVGKKFTRTYNINHIAPSNDYDYIYITIRGFQEEEIETVKVTRSQFESLVVGDNVEITFEIESDEIEDNLKSIFKYSKVTSASKTDKTGLEQINETF